MQKNMGLDVLDLYEIKLKGRGEEFFGSSLGYKSDVEECERG